MVAKRNLDEVKAEVERLEGVLLQQSEDGKDENAEHKELMKQVAQLNVLTESNVQLREEKER